MASISVIGSSCCPIAGVKFWPLLNMAGTLRIALEALWQGLLVLRLSMKERSERDAHPEP